MHVKTNELEAVEAAMESDVALRCLQWKEANRLVGGHLQNMGSALPYCEQPDMKCPVRLLPTGLATLGRPDERTRIGDLPSLHMFWDRVLNVGRSVRRRDLERPLRQIGLAYATIGASGGVEVLASGAKLRRISMGRISIIEGSNSVKFGVKACLFWKWPESRTSSEQEISRIFRIMAENRLRIVQHAEGPDRHRPLPMDDLSPAWS